MRKDNPACYECPKGRNGLHHWHVNNRDDGQRTAKCDKCGLRLNEVDTADMMTE